MFMIFVTGDFVKIQLSLFVLHITFQFLLYFLNTKDFNIGGTGLSNMNFVNISSKTKFVHTFKCYQKSLEQLKMTTTEEEKEAI